MKTGQPGDNYYGKLRFHRLTAASPPARQVSDRQENDDCPRSIRSGSTAPRFLARRSALNVLAESRAPHR